MYAGIDRADPGLPWHERIRATALSTYRALSRHPVVPLGLATEHANPTSWQALQPIDDLAGALYEAGLHDDGYGRRRAR